MNRRLWITPMLLAACSRPPTPSPVVEASKPDKEVSATWGQVVLDAAMRQQAAIKVEPARLRALPESIQTTGRLTVDDNRTWRVGAITDGRIVRVYVHPGDRVVKDQLLAGMHSHEIHEARAAYKKANSELARLRTALAYAQRYRDRAQRLYELKAGSLEQLDHAEAELQNARIAVTNAEAELERTRRHLVEFLQVAVEDHPGHDAEAHDHPADLIPIRSPADGVLLERKVTAGSVASAGDELFVVSDLRSLWMIAAIGEEHLPRLRVGMAVRVWVQAYPDRSFAGRIVRMGDRLDPETRTIPVRVELANPQGDLKPEMYATAQIEIGPSRQAVFVPEIAVQQIEGRPAIFVHLDGDRFLARPVHTGRRLDGMIEILDGLQPGERFVSEGGFLLKSQMLRSTLEE